MQASHKRRWGGGTLRPFCSLDMTIRRLRSNRVEHDLCCTKSTQEDSVLRDNIVKSQKDPNKLVGMEWCVDLPGHVPAR